MGAKRRSRAWSLSALPGALTSVACMGSMGAMGIAASAGAGAAATGGMAGMGGTGAEPSGRGAVTTQFLQNMGLGALTQIPDAVLRPIFVGLLLVGVLGAYLAYRIHKQTAPLAVTLLASVLLYIGVYVVPSDLLYYISLALLITGAIWNMVVRSRAPVQASPDKAIIE